MAPLISLINIARGSLVDHSRRGEPAGRWTTLKHPLWRYPMLTIGDKFPDYELTGVVSNDAATAFAQFGSKDRDKGWRIVFFCEKTTGIPLCVVK